MNLSQKEIQLAIELYPTIEGMKHRFKETFVGYPTLASELVWDSRTTERGVTKRTLREQKAKARKPYWRKKRTLARRTSPKYLYSLSLEKRDDQ